MFFPFMRKKIYKTPIEYADFSISINGAFSQNIIKNHKNTHCWWYQLFNKKTFLKFRRNFKWTYSLDEIKLYFGNTETKIVNNESNSLYNLIKPYVNRDANIDEYFQIGYKYVDYIWIDKKTPENKEYHLAFFEDENKNISSLLVYYALFTDKIDEITNSDFDNTGISDYLKNIINNQKVVVYKYNDFNQIDEVSIIYDFINENSIKTNRGITVGDDINEVFKKYGDEGLYTFKIANGGLILALQNALNNMKKDLCKITDGHFVDYFISDVTMDDNNGENHIIFVTDNNYKIQCIFNICQIKYINNSMNFTNSFF